MLLFYLTQVMYSSSSLYYLSIYIPQVIETRRGEYGTHQNARPGWGSGQESRETSERSVQHGKADGRTG